MAHSKKLHRIEYRFKEEKYNEMIHRVEWTIRKSYHTEECMKKDIKHIKNLDIFYYRMVYPDGKVILINDLKQP